MKIIKKQQKSLYGSIPDSTFSISVNEGREMLLGKTIQMAPTSTTESPWAAFSSNIYERKGPAEVDAYYDIYRGKYLIHNGESWIYQTQTGYTRRLRAAGFSHRIEDHQKISQVDQEIIRVQNERAISYAGALAGYQAGVYKMGGVKVLVTESSNLHTPEPGQFPTLKAVFEAVLKDDEIDQLTTFYSWMKVSLQSLHTSCFIPGQAIAFAGPRQSGKSLIQSLLTEIFGGRAAKPYSYMIGKTKFNSDHFPAVHQMIEDECATTKKNDRLKLAASLKEKTVNKSQRMHAKGKDALMLEPFWRVSISLNEEPEDLLVLPPLDEGTMDKIILMRAHKRELPITSEFKGDRESFWEALNSEIPAFSYWLLNTFKIPEELQDDRFGVKFLHHPVLVKELIEISDEQLLLDMIDRNLDLPMESSAKGIREMLYEAVEQSRQLIPTDCKTGRLLTALSGMPEQRVFKDEKSGGNTYRIIPEK